MKNVSGTVTKKKASAFVCLFACVLLLFSSIAAIASYVNTNSKKLVVAKYGDTGMRFSSNYLRTGNIETSYIFVDAPASVGDAVDVSGSVRISNFPQENQTVFYEVAINYTLDIRLVYESGGIYAPVTADNAASVVGERYIEIVIDNGDPVTMGYLSGSYNYQHTVSRSLPGRQSSTTNISVTFDRTQIASLLDPPEGYKRLYLQITATPTASSHGSYSDLSAISGRVGVALISSETLVSWEGFFSDEPNARTGAGAVTDDYDGYNYVIDGYGAATLTLKWKPEYLNLNEIFIGNVIGSGAVESDGTWKWITFTPGDTSHFQMQFYKSGIKSSSVYSTWNQISGYVQFSFSE